MALISIVVPAYNAEKTITRCIESILNQTASDFELILVNDGSKDNTAQICDEYAMNDSRISVIHKENEGVSIARNTGIMQANSDYIMFIDSDDYIAPNMFKLLLDKIVGTSYSVVMCGYNRKFIFNGKETKSYIILPEVSSIDTIDEYKKKWSNLYAKSLFNAPWGKLFKLADIKGNNIEFDPNLNCGEDLLFNLEVFSNIYKIAIVNQPLYIYECTEKESLTTKFIPNKDINDKLLYNKTMDYLKRMNMVDDNQNSVALIYMRSCLITFEQILLFTKDLTLIEKKGYINSVVNCNEMVTALKTKISHNKESLIYALILKTKSYLILSFFTRLRYKFKTMLRKGFKF